MTPPVKRADRAPARRPAASNGVRPASTVPAQAAGRPRCPQQARGERRVEAILDAAAALIVESGATTLTMQAIARRSGTASGSLYHFFPDRDAVMRALAARHVHGLHGVLAATRAGVAAAQAEANGMPVSAAALVDQMLEPVFAYKAKHPEYHLVEDAV